MAWCRTARAVSSYNDNAYFAPHDVLIHNYAVVAAGEALNPNNEIDQYSWVPVDEFLDQIMPHLWKNALKRNISVAANIIMKPVSWYN